MFSSLLHVKNKNIKMYYIMWSFFVVKEMLWFRCFVIKEIFQSLYNYCNSLYIFTSFNFPVWWKVSFIPRAVSAFPAPAPAPHTGNILPVEPCRKRPLSALGMKYTISSYCFKNSCFWSMFNDAKVVYFELVSKRFVLMTF